MLLWVLGAYVGWWWLFVWLLPAVLESTGFVYGMIALPMAYLLPFLVAAGFSYAHGLRSHLASHEAAWAGSGAMVMLILLNQLAGWFRVGAVPLREHRHALPYLLVAVILASGASWVGARVAVWQIQRAHEEGA